jgi:acyl-CoA synthetase (AMP-forming)/AMP-acid ligase II
MLECHYGVPMCGAVLNTLNTRLDAATIAFSLDHGQARALITDREFAPVVRAALAKASAKPLVIDYDDPEFGGPGDRLGELEYEALLAEGDPTSPGSRPKTSGTRSRSTTRPARPAIRRASSTTIAAPTYRHRQHPVREHGPASSLSLDLADVPLQRLVLPVDNLGSRRHACLPALGQG